MRDIRQTPQYAKYLKNIGWKVETIHGTNYFIKKFPVIGSILKIQRPESIKLIDINYLIKKYRVIQTIIEPKNEDQVESIKYLGFKLSKSPYLPTKTLQIDLTLSKEKLLKELHKKTRYNVKKYTNYNIQITNSNNIEGFVTFWHQCHRKRMAFLSQKKEISSLYKAFGKNCDLWFATNQNKLIATLMVINCGMISYYMYAASSPEGKKLFAPTLLTWEAILKTRSRGAMVFDFEGIYDERFPIKTWKGFDRFKKSFGGYEVEYPGAFTKTKIRNIIQL